MGSVATGERKPDDLRYRKSVADAVEFFSVTVTLLLAAVAWVLILS